MGIKAVILILSLAFVLLIITTESVNAEIIQTQTVEYEPAYNDLKIIRAGDMVNTSWNSYQAFNNETNMTTTYYRDYSTIQIYFFYLGNNQTYSLSEAHTNYGVNYGTWINYNTGTSAKWGGTVNTDAVNPAIKDNGYYVVFELVEGTTQPKVRDGKLYLDDHVSIDWKDLDNPSNQFKIYNKTLVYLTNNGSAFHDTIIYDPIINVENVTINSKLNNIRADDTFTYIEIDDSPGSIYENLSGYWSFDGDAVDDAKLPANMSYDFSKHNNDGVMVDDAHVNASGCMNNYGNCLQLDGAGDYISIDPFTADEGVAEFSVSFWMNNGVGGAPPSNEYPLAHYQGSNNVFIFRADSDGDIRFSVYNESEAQNSYTTDMPCDDTDWHHIVGVYNGTRVMVYVDSIAAAYTEPLTGVTDTAGQALTIGILEAGSIEFNGSIDEVMIFNTSLTPAQIKAIYFNSSHRFKEVGNHTLLPVNISDGYDRANVTATISNNMSSNISLRLGQINITAHNTTGLVGYWPMEWGNDTDNQVWDISGQANHGTPVGFSETSLSGWNSTGGYDGRGAYEFDGDGDYVDVPPILLGTNFTICAWVYVPFSGTYKTIFGMDNNNNLYTYNDKFTFYESGHLYSSSHEAGWYFVTIRKNNTNREIWVNGELEISGDIGVEWTLNYLGYSGYTSEYWNGTIDDVLIFNRALSADEISQLYTNSSAGHSQIYYTEWANLTSGSNIHTIDEEADFLFAQMRYYPGNSTGNPFMSPNIKGNITIETFSSEEAPTDTLAPDNVGFLLPTPLNDTNLSQNNYMVNVSFNDSNPNLCQLEITNTSGVINYSMTQGANTSEWYINASHTNNMTHFTAYCRDVVGNWNHSETRSVNISYAAPADTEAPHFSGYATNTTPHEDRDVVLNVTITDSDSVVDEVILELTNEDTPITTNFTGALNESTEWYINIDQDNYTAHDNITWFWYANDTGNNLNMSSQQEFTVVNQIPTTPGHSTPTTNNWSDDKTIPFIWSSSNDADGEDSITYYIYINDTINSSTTNTYINIDFPDGQWNWNLTADDGYDNSTQSADWYLTIDTIIPSVSITSPTNATNTNSDVTIEGTCTDTNLDNAYTNSTYFTGIDTSPGSFSFANTSSLPNGLEDVIVYCNDSANNTVQAEVYFTYDNVNPSPAFISPTRGNVTYYHISTSINISVDENVDAILEFINASGTINYTMTCFNSSSTTSCNFTPTTDDYETLFMVYVTDSAGNINATGQRNVTIDTVVPDLYVLFPVSAEVDEPYWPNSTIYMWVNDTNLKDVRCVFSYPNGTYVAGMFNTSPVNNYYYTTLDISSGDGNVTGFNCIGRDQANLENVTSDDYGYWSFIVDTTEPGFSDNKTNATVNEDQDIEINITVTDAGIGVDTVIIEFTNETNTINYTMFNVSSEYYFPIDQGNYTAHDNISWYFYANDSFNNLNRSPVYYVTIANQAPSAPILGIPANNSNLSTASVTFNWSLSTDADAEDTITYYLMINGSVNLSNANTTNWTTVSFPDGAYFWNIYADDNYTNTSSLYRNFTVDTTYPIVSIDLPLNNTYQAGNSTQDLLINVSASDSGVGMDSCYTNSTYFTQILSSGLNFTNTSSLPDGLHDIMVYCNDSANNTQSAEVYFRYDINPPSCFLESVTPSDLEENSTGLYEAIINCSDVNDINTSTWLFTRTVEAFEYPGIPNYWSIRPPDNTKGQNFSNLWTIGYMLRADGRADNHWYDSYQVDGANLFNDNFTYAVTDNRSVRITITVVNSTDAVLNFSWRVEPIVFRSSIFLSRGEMEKENKTYQEYEIYKDNGLLVKFWDLETIRGIQNYTAISFRNIQYSGNPNKDLLAYYLNSSFDPAGAIAPSDSPNGVFLNSLDTTDLDTLAYTSRNSSYSSGTYGITNGLIGGINTTDTFYVYYESDSIGVTGSYLMRFANGSSDTNVSFKDSEVAWITSDDGATFTQAEFTPDVHFSGVASGDESLIGIYVEDNAGNNLTNFTFIHDDIGEVNHPISSPNIDYYQSPTGRDDNKNGTHRNTMTIRVLMAIDPDGPGTVNHSLYLYTLDGVFNYIINESFNSSDDCDVNVSFDTNLVVDGVYKVNVTARADDNQNDFQDYITSDNFTIDNTNPDNTGFIFPTPANDTNLTQDNYFINASFNDTNPDWCRIEFTNTSGTMNYTMSQGANRTEYNFNATGQGNNMTSFLIYCNDSAGNLANSSIRFVNITAPDTTQPDISFIFPTPDNDTNLSQNNYLVNVSITEAASAVIIEFTNSSGTINYTMTQATTTNFNINLTGQSDFITYFFVYANDTSNNFNRSLVRFVLIDTLAPDNVGFLAPTPANDTNLSQNNYLVNVSANDTNMNLCVLEITNTSGTINYSMTQGANISEWYINTSHSNNMTSYIAYCNDTSGNWGSSEIRFVNISIDEGLVISNMEAFEKGMEWMKWNWSISAGVIITECELYEDGTRIEFFNTTLKTYNRTFLTEDVKYNLTCRGHDPSGSGEWVEIVERTESVFDKTIINLKILKNWLSRLLEIGGII